MVPLSSALEARDTYLKTPLVLLSAASFLGYGLACFFTRRMQREFVRYGMGPQRRVVGFLQVCAGFGLLAGLVQPWIGQAASGGLALMMLVAVWVRVQIQDSLLQTLPALFYFALNAYLCLVVF